MHQRKISGDFWLEKTFGPRFCIYIYAKEDVALTLNIFVHIIFNKKYIYNIYNNLK